MTDVVVGAIAAMVLALGVEPQAVVVPKVGVGVTGRTETRVGL